MESGKVKTLELENLLIFNVQRRQWEPAQFLGTK